MSSPRDMASLGERLNKALDGAGLSCGDIESDTYRCTGKSDGREDTRGYVGEVRLSSLDYGRYMLVVTAVGIRCGFDESAYLYRRGPDHKWTLLFESEQDDYATGHYAPQNFLAIDVSPANVAWNEAAGPPLVLTLGDSPWCTSNWNALSTHLWRASNSTPAPKPLIDRTDTLYRGDDFIASERLTRNDVVIEFRGASLDDASHVRSHVLHYLIHQADRVERIGPVALNPNDFVEEWLTSDWSEAGLWTDARGAKSSLSRLHQTWPKGIGEFGGPPRRCRPDLVADQLRGQRRPSGRPPAAATHFLVRWMAPYRFSLAGARRRPFPGCDTVVAMPDDLGTLFPSPGWTR